MQQDELWKTMLRAGADAYGHGQYRQARARFRAAARDAKQRNVSAQVAISLHNLALLYKEQHRVRKAFNIMEKALDFLERAGEANSRLASDILDKLAELTVSRDRRRAIVSEDRIRAIAFLERAHTIDCAAAGSYQPHMPKRLMWLAELNYKEGNYARACELYKEACDTTIIRHDRQLLLRRKKPSLVVQLTSRKEEIDFSPPIVTPSTAPDGIQV